MDYVLDDCFQLISLFFLTIGRNNEAPAVWVLPVLIRLFSWPCLTSTSYSMTSTIKVVGICYSLQHFRCWYSLATPWSSQRSGLLFSQRPRICQPEVGLNARDVKAREGKPLAASSETLRKSSRHMSSPVVWVAVITRRSLSSANPRVRTVGIHSALDISGQYKAEGLGPLFLQIIYSWLTWPSVPNSRSSKLSGPTPWDSGHYGWWEFRSRG